MKKNISTMTRRDFVTKVGPMMVGVPVILQVTACGGGDSSSGAGSNTSTPTNTTSSTGSTTTSFTGSATDGSHPHSFTVQCSDLAGGQSKTYTATGSGHTHPVTLSAAQLNTVNNGGTVTLSTSDSHRHTWRISKPAGVC